MKTLIVYGTTYGFAEDCARKLAGQVQGEAVLVNAAREKAPGPDGFDAVVIGGSVYMGRIQKQVAEYCAANLNALLGKRMALFLCGGIAEEYEKNMQANFPAALLDVAVSREYYGGELRRSEMSLPHKIVMAAVTKARQKDGIPEPAMIPGNIDRTAQALA